METVADVLQVTGRHCQHHRHRCHRHLHHLHHLHHHRHLHLTSSSSSASLVLQGQSGKPFELILMDVSLPLMDGFTATALIRKLETSAAAARVPVLALTAFATKADKEKCLPAGMDDYLTKPVHRTPS